MRLTRLLSEARRRRVGRVAVAYAITAWAAIQVADVIFPRLSFPEWTVTALIVVALAGFPVALALAWFYDVVPDAASAPAATRRRRTVVAALTVLAVLLVTGALTTRVWPELLGTNARIESIAVLPFDNLSQDGEQEYFVAGMHDALITELAQIGSIRVVSRKSTMRFRDSDASIGEIARELDVDGVVEGSVLKVGGDLRMQVQLIRATPRETHVWAESFDRRVEDARRLHGEIARTIADEIRLRLTPAEERLLAHERSIDPRAYEAYLRGMYLLSQQTPDDYRNGLRYLIESVQLDPGDAYAHAGLALGYALIGHGTIPDAFERAKAAADRALALDSTVAAAYEAKAEIALYRDWRYADAEAAFRRVHELNPNLPEASGHFGWLSLLYNRDEDALAWMDRAISLDPVNPLWPAWLGWLYLNMGVHDSALAHAQAGLELGPGHPHALFVAAVAAARLDRDDEATAYAERLEQIPPYRWGAAYVYALTGDDARAAGMVPGLEADGSPMTAFGLAIVHGELGDLDRGFEWMERAVDTRFSWIPWIHRDINFTPFHGDPRFDAMLERIGVREPPLQLVAMMPIVAADPAP